MLFGIARTTPQFQSGADFWGPGTPRRGPGHDAADGFQSGADFWGPGTEARLATRKYQMFQSGADFWGPGTKDIPFKLRVIEFQSGADFWGPGTAPRFVGVLSWANAGRCANLSLAAGR